MELTADLMDAISAESGRPTLLAIDDFHLVDSSPQVVDAVGLIAGGFLRGGPCSCRRGAPSRSTWRPWVWEAGS